MNNSRGNRMYTVDYQKYLTQTNKNINKRESLSKKYLCTLMRAILYDDMYKVIKTRCV